MKNYNSYLYHLTALRNMETIFKYGLLSRKGVENLPYLESIGFTDIADDDIISYRDEHNITNYIPFHFLPLSPFAGVVQKKYLDIDFVYIAIPLNYAKANNFCIIPQHPMSGEMKGNPQIFNFEDGMKAIDWDMMNERDYRDPYGKMVCMAECISYKTLNIYEMILNNQVLFFVKDIENKKDLIGICYNIFPQINIESIIEVMPNFFVKK